VRTDTWEGDFSWQEYVLTGRPDLLNYIHVGDVTWERVWSFCRDRMVAPEVALRVFRLFHASLSAAYDGAGCWLDPDGEIYSELHGWSRYVLGRSTELSEEELLSGLALLLDTGLITPLYFGAVFAVYVETVLDGSAEAWRRDPGAIRAPVSALASPGDARPGGGTALLEARALPAYAPDPTRYVALQDDPEWERAMCRLLDDHYQAWNRVYLATSPDDDLDVAFSDEGGEG
jgi:hypothetical protein